MGLRPIHSWFALASASSKPFAQSHDPFVRTRMIALLKLDIMFSRMVLFFDEHWFFVFWGMAGKREGELRIEVAR